MNVRNLLEKKNRETLTITPNDTMETAIKRMTDNHVGSLVVVEGDKPINIVTERDVLFAIHRRNYDIQEVKISEITEMELVTCDISANIKEAMTLMFENKIGRRIRHLPIVDNGKLVGLISNGDLLLRLLEVSEFENRLLKNYIQNWPEEDAG